MPKYNFIKKEILITDNDKKFIKEQRKEINDIIIWKDKRKLLIIWPCSIDWKESILEYAKKLSYLNKNIKDRIKIIMRVYPEKPRTNIWRQWYIYSWEVNSWKWIVEWIKETRKIMKEISEIWLPIWMELLDPYLIPFFDDIISYWSIWARTSESQVHRKIASLYNSILKIPVWIKNCTSWDFEVSINSIISSSNKHSFIPYWDNIYESEKNFNSHIILRWEKFNWKILNNFDKVNEYSNKLNKIWLNWNIIVDLSHDNSYNNETLKKDYLKQIENFNKLIINKDINKNIVWYMIESYLYDWNQNECSDINQIKKWKSLTDPCIWWEKTEKLINGFYKYINI